MSAPIRDVPEPEKTVTLLELYQLIGGMLTEYPELTHSPVMIPMDSEGNKINGLQRACCLRNLVLGEPDHQELQREAVLIIPAFAGVLPGQELSGLPVIGDRN